MLDALERNCLEFVYSSTAPDSSIPDVILENISKLDAYPSSVNIMNFEFTDASIQFIQKYEEFQQEVRKERHGITAQLWWAYADRVCVLKRFQRSITENNLELFKKSLHQMSKFLFSADHLNYARYLSLKFTELENLPYSHPGAQELLTDKGLSVARSTVPGCRNAVDLTIEQTLNRSGKCFLSSC